MRVDAQSIVLTMAGWVGLSRSKGTHKIIIDTYNNHKPLARGYRVTYTDAYCATTVSAAFIKNDAVDMLGGTECGCEEFIKIFKRKGIWNEDGTIVPAVGHIILYDWDKSTQPNDEPADHIGIVESVNREKNVMVVIEGNYHGDVARRTIGIGDGHIRGYAIPDYKIKNEKETISIGETIEVDALVSPNSSTPCSGTLVSNTNVKIRKSPDWTVRDRWFHCKYGYISAYVFTGWIKDATGWWYLRPGYKYCKNEAFVVKGKEYHFDSNGYMLTPSRIAQSGEVLY